MYKSFDGVDDSTVSKVEKTEVEEDL